MPTPRSLPARRTRAVSRIIAVSHPSRTLVSKSMSGSDSRQLEVHDRAALDWNTSPGGGLVPTGQRTSSYEASSATSDQSPCHQPIRPMIIIRKFIAEETAATAIEYCLIATGIALGILVAIAGIEARINADFTALNSSLKYGHRNAPRSGGARSPLLALLSGLNRGPDLDKCRFCASLFLQSAPLQRRRQLQGSTQRTKHAAQP